MRRLLGQELGYSLVEVMASILILSIAIIPMVGMFDAGLKSTTLGSNYDRARALANLKLEEAKSLPYVTVRDSFPAASTAPGTSGAYVDPSWRTYTGTNSADFSGFVYKVDKQYIVQPSKAPTSSSQPFASDTSGSDSGLMRVTVTVQWDGSKTYGTSALVSK